MWHETYGVFWDQKPLFPRADEVALRVEPVGHARTALPPSNPDVFKLPSGSVRFEADGMFRTSCDGRADVFKVVEVLHGAFERPEIAIVYPVIGDPFDAPIKGERRIVVGRVLPPVQLEERRINNGVELDRLIESGGVDERDIMDRYVTERVGDPSSVPRLDFRTPIEFPVKRFLHEWSNLPLANQIGFAAAGIVILAGAVFLIRAIARLLQRRRRGAPSPTRGDPA